MGRARRTIRALVATLAVAAVPLPSASAQACSKTWTSTSGSWTTAANWSPGVPGAADDVCLTGTQTYTVTVPAVAGGVHVCSLTVGGEVGVGSDQTLEIDGQSVAAGTVTQPSTLLDAALGGTIASTGRVVLNATDVARPGLRVRSRGARRSSRAVRSPTRRRSSPSPRRLGCRRITCALRSRTPQAACYA